MPGVLVELQLGCFMSRDLEWMDCSHSAYLMHFQYKALHSLAFFIMPRQSKHTQDTSLQLCAAAVPRTQLSCYTDFFKCQNVLRTQSKVLKSGPNLKPLSQNTLIIRWSFSLHFHHSLISSLRLTSECHGCMGCAWISSHTQTLQMWDSICWLDHQKLSRYSNRLLLGITPKEEEKSNKVFISGSQMKRIPCECHKVLQEHNCFWALICFSAATTGGKGVNTVVNVSVHNLSCTPCDGPSWNHGKLCTEEKVLRVISNILSWETAFHNWCVKLHTPWFSFQCGCQVF